MNETPIVFECLGEPLVGIVAEPAAPATHGVLIIVGGPQYRIGSHRQYVRLARELAAAGIASLRFDYRALGDSGGAFVDVEDISPDVGAALDALHRQVPSLRSVALWGLCGGASAALLYWLERRDPRVGGLALVNPWIRSEVTQARTRLKHYYLQRLAQPAFWRKLLSGDVARAALPDLLRSVRQTVRPSAEAHTGRGLSDAEIARRMRDGWAAYPGPILLALSGNDFTAKQFLEAVALDRQWRRNLAKPGVRRVDLVDADHTFTDRSAHAAVLEATVALVRSMAAAPAAAPGRGAVPAAVAAGRG